MQRKLQTKSTNTSFPIPDEGCFICIDKPKGPTSHQVDHWIRTLTGIQRVGHIGTLDPQATGLLVIALSRAVRLVDIAHEYPKEYIGSMKLHAESDEESITKAFDFFKGEVYQLPPIKSAIVRKLRSRIIYDLQIMEIRGRDILFRVKCQSGTYIRTLCLDIGYYLGTKANMTDLRRTETGPFKLDMAITLQELSDMVELAKDGKDHRLRSAIYQPNFLLSEFSKVVVKTSALRNIAHGSDIFPGGIKAIIGEPLAGDRVAVISEMGSLVGTGKMISSFNQISDTKIVDLDRVLIDPEVTHEARGKGTEKKPEQAITVHKFKDKSGKDRSGNRRQQSNTHSSKKNFREDRDRHPGNNKYRKNTRRDKPGVRR